jgi:hypothetical protein
MAGTVQGGGPTAIEVGATRGDGTLRYWQAKEAVGKGELLLGSQISALSRIMSSATSILGWSVTISLALSGVIASTLVAPVSTHSTTGAALGHLLWAAASAETLLIAAATCCVCVLWPSRWHPPGHDPALLMEAPYDSELEILEGLAGGYAQAAARNSRGLDRLEKFLRTAWLCFVAAPIVGLLVFAAT